VKVAAEKAAGELDIEKFRHHVEPQKRNIFPASGTVKSAGP
jgi:hypothetical protein